MAKTTVIGEAMVITAEFTTKELKLVEKRCPSALSLYELGFDGSKTEVFRVGTGKGETICSLGKYGINFPAIVREPDAKASLTVLLPSGIEGDLEEFIVDTYGTPLASLNKIEKQVAAALVGIKEDTDELLSSITFA